MKLRELRAMFLDVDRPKYNLVRFDTPDALKRMMCGPGCAAAVCQTKGPALYYAWCSMCCGVCCLCWRSSDVSGKSLDLGPVPMYIAVLMGDVSNDLRICVDCRAHKPIMKLKELREIFKSTTAPTKRAESPPPQYVGFERVPPNPEFGVWLDQHYRLQYECDRCNRTGAIVDLVLVRRLLDTPVSSLACSHCDGACIRCLRVRDADRKPIKLHQVPGQDIVLCADCARVF